MMVLTVRRSRFDFHHTNLLGKSQGNLLEIHDPINERFIRYEFRRAHSSSTDAEPIQFNDFFFGALFFASPLLFLLEPRVCGASERVSECCAVLWVYRGNDIIVAVAKNFFRNDAMIIYIVIYVRGAAQHSIAHTRSLLLPLARRRMCTHTHTLYYAIVPWRKYVYDRMSPYPLIYIS